MDIDLIGGLDHYTIDGAIEKTIDFTVQLALDNHKRIDIHKHETGESGLKTAEYLIGKVNENKSLKGKLLPLDENGNQLWPKPGDAAHVVLIDASCSAEAVSRISAVHSLIHNGNILY